jgi:hypothetical protein
MGNLISCFSKKSAARSTFEEHPFHSGNINTDLASPTKSPSDSNARPLRPLRSFNSFDPQTLPSTFNGIAGADPTAARMADVPLGWSPSSDLIIGIDFGTTFTGVAYAHAAGIGPVTTEDDMRRAAEKVSVIRTWPSRSNHYAEKTPSVLAYNKKPPLWGGNVKPTDEPQIACFKLGLQEDITSHYYELGTSGTTSVLGGYLANHDWKHPDLPEMTASDYSRDYLHSINQYVTQEILPNRFGARFLQNQTLSYVITVPAIWSDKAKELTRQAAYDAGIDRNNLILITEPEAAAIYCATLCTEVDLEPGDRFMICDAGGGTVVYPIKCVVITSGSDYLQGRNSETV